MVIILIMSYADLMGSDTLECMWPAFCSESERFLGFFFKVCRAFGGNFHGVIGMLDVCFRASAP